MIKVLDENQIKLKIIEASAAEMELVFIPLIMSKQTKEEVRAEVTTEHNSVGLNAYDAKTISKYFRIISHGEHLTEEQLKTAKVKLLKYSKQYVVIAQERIQHVATC